MDLSNINSAALRSSRLSSGELGRHDERDIKSRPYSSFKWLSRRCSCLFVQTRRNYALSDKNGYYYVLGKNDNNVTYGQGAERINKASVEYGPYQRKKIMKWKWVGLNKGNAMWSDKRLLLEKC